MQSLYRHCACHKWLTILASPNAVFTATAIVTGGSRLSPQELSIIAAVLVRNMKGGAHASMLHRRTADQGARRDADKKGWGVRMQALESVLNNYRMRHAQCVSSTTLPGKYIVMSMADDYAGLGNQFPSVITGDRPTRHRSSMLLIVIMLETLALYSARGHCVRKVNCSTAGPNACVRA